MPKPLIYFKHVLLLSEREELCTVERYSLRQIGLPFSQHLSTGAAALELIAQNNLPNTNYSGTNFSGAFSSGASNRLVTSNQSSLGQARLGLKTPVADAALIASNQPVDLIICTERMEDAHSLRFMAVLRSMPGAANIPVLAFPDSTRFWREAEKLGGCCLARPYTLRELQSALHLAQHLARQFLPIQAKEGRVQVAGFNFSAEEFQELWRSEGGSSSKSTETKPPVNAQSRERNEYEEEAGLGLAKPEPPKREPFALIEENTAEEPVTVKREAFTLIEESAKEEPVAVKREAFTLIDEGEDIVLPRPKRAPFPLIEEQEPHLSTISGVSAEPSFNPTPTVTESDSIPRAQRPEAGSRSFTQNAASTQPASLGGLESIKLTQAEELLFKGFHLNAAKAFLSVSKEALHNQSLDHVIASACQFTTAPKENLRAMRKALDMLGYPELAKRLERCLKQMYGTEDEQTSSSLLKDVFSVARMTFSAWREPEQMADV